MDDRCGLTEEHAMELKNIVDKILSETHSEKVNIVAHSKGGLDARWYIANSDPDKVANLIMIGTPNAGSPGAFVDITGCPFGSDIDLFPGSLATQVVDFTLKGPTTTLLLETGCQMICVWEVVVLFLALMMVW